MTLFGTVHTLEIIPKYYCLFNRKTIHTVKNVLKKCTDWGRGRGCGGGRRKEFCPYNLITKIVFWEVVQLERTPPSILFLVEVSRKHYRAFSVQKEKTENAQQITCEVTAKNKGGWNTSTKLLQWSCNSSTYLATFQLQQLELHSHLGRSEKYMQVSANWVSVSNTSVFPTLKDILNCSGGKSLPAWTP